MRPPALVLPKSRSELRGEVKPVANRVLNFASDAAVITAFSEIGGPDGLTAERVNSYLRQIGNQPVVLKINSPGGDAYEGVAIYNLLRSHSATVTAQVLGIAASAASIVAMAADEIAMARNSQIMIHQAWMFSVGNADLFRDAADFLDKLDLAIAGTYAARTGQPLKRVSDLMSAETFMSADEAIDMGFADSILEADASPAPVALADANLATKRQLSAADAYKRQTLAVVEGSLFCFGGECPLYPRKRSFV